MNEKIKSFFCVIGGFIAGIIASIFSGKNKRRNNDDVGNSIRRGKQIITDAGKTNRRIKNTVGRIKQEEDEIARRYNSIERYIDREAEGNKRAVELSDDIRTTNDSIKRAISDCRDLLQQLASEEVDNIH